MSYDLQSERLCDHRTIEDLYVADADRRSIYLVRPVSNTSEVYLRMNGVLIPKHHPKFGWSLVDNEFSIEPNRRLKILFDKPLPSIDDFFEVTFYTQAVHCRKCHGQKVIRDLIFTASGKPRRVIDEQKLIQNILKGVVSILGTNVFHTWYGTKIYPLIGSATRDERYIANTIRSEVIAFCKSLKDMQDQQSEYQDVTLRELLQNVNSVEVYRNPQTPTIWYVDITATTRAGNIISVTRDLTVPSVTDFEFQKKLNINAFG